MMNEYAQLEDPDNPCGLHLDPYGIPINPPNLLAADISKGDGSSKYPIPAINDVDSEKLPVGFIYVSVNVDPDKIYSEEEEVGCSCAPGACRPGSCKCIDESPIKLYSDGTNILVKDVTKLADTFYTHHIFECSSICNCGGKCQHRMTPLNAKFDKQVQIYRTEKAGFGVRSLQFIKQGMFICEFTGEALSQAEVAKRPQDYPYSVSCLGSEYNQDYFVDPTTYGNVARFFNHSCNESMVPIRFFSTHRSKTRPHIGFVAVRDIFPYDELTINYGHDWWRDKAIKESFHCMCGELNCMWPSPEFLKLLNKMTNEEKLRLMNQKALLNYKKRLELEKGKLIDGEKYFGSLWKKVFSNDGSSDSSFNPFDVKSFIK